MDEDFFTVASTAILLMIALCLKRRNKRQQRRWWVNPYLRGRDFRGRFNDVRENDFVSYLKWNLIN